MSEEGMIVVQAHFNPSMGRKEHLTFSWEGGPVVDISYPIVDQVDPNHEYRKTGKFKIGPYRLRYIEDLPYKAAERFIREDGPFWRVAAAWYRYGKVFDLAYRRLIITLAVWNLADYDRAAIPNWRDIRALRKVSDWLK